MIRISKYFSLVQIWIKPLVSVNFQMAGEEGMGSCAITTVPSKDLFHVTTGNFAQVQQAKNRLLKVLWHIGCCAHVSCNMMLSYKYDNG